MVVGDLNQILDATPLDTSVERENPTQANILPDFYSWTVQATEVIPAWWSVNRDIELRRFWKRNDYLAGALYAMLAKMTAIPFRIEARDPSVKAYKEDAYRAEERLRSNSQLGQGFDAAYELYLMDLLVCDNGGFWLVLGDGPADGPIIGPAMGVMHLDSTRCIRTRNPFYPVLYTHRDGRQYKIHYTRIMYNSQMTSPIMEMNGVGFSAVSRAIYTGQHLYDISRYEMEQLGSRPMQGLLVGSYVSARQLMTAMQLGADMSDSNNLQRYSRLGFVGNANHKVEVDFVGTNSLPSGYDKDTDIAIGMYTIALALGVDARELWPASASGATKADALVQHLKARGKGPGKILLSLERMFNHKFLPPHLKLVFDYIDDEQDAARAKISLDKSMQRKNDIQSGVLTISVARQQMLDDGEINEDQFLQMELQEGRLQDGTSVLLLFNASDPATRSMLELGVRNVVDVQNNIGQADDIISRINERLNLVDALVHNADNRERKRSAMMARYALDFLRRQYQEAVAPAKVESEVEGQSDDTDEQE